MTRLALATLLCALKTTQASAQNVVSQGLLELNDEERNASFTLLLRDSDRRELQRVMNQEVLETIRFPEIAFESSQVKADRQKDDLYRLNVQGRLALHGEVNEHSFVAQVALGVDTARAYGEFKLRQTDYSIRIASIAGGTLRLQDELKFSFYVVARKQT